MTKIDIELYKGRIFMLTTQLEGTVVGIHNHGGGRELNSMLITHQNEKLKNTLRLLSTLLD